MNTTSNNYFFDPSTAKCKVVVESGSEIINWVRETITDGFMIVPTHNVTQICLFGDAGHMMYLLKWS